MNFRSKPAVLFLFLLAALPLAAQNVQVNSADPPSAPQSAVNLNVTIQGRGFRRGAVARFFVTGSINPGGVQVNSTTFVGGSTLVANIDIAADATISLFDIEVENDDGRTGKGIELFINMITLTTVDMHEATLWKITQGGDLLLGTYKMPFEVTITIPTIP